MNHGLALRGITASLISLISISSLLCSTLFYEGSLFIVITFTVLFSHFYFLEGLICIRTPICRILVDTISSCIKVIVYFLCTSELLDISTLLIKDKLLQLLRFLQISVLVCKRGIWRYTWEFNWFQLNHWGELLHDSMFTFSNVLGWWVNFLFWNSLLVFPFVDKVWDLWLSFYEFGWY